MVANSISQYVQAKSSGDAAAIKKAEQGIGDSLGQAIQKINDGATLAELKDSLDTQIDRSKETQKWLTILGAVAVVTLDNPANGPAALAGVVAVALSEIVSTQVAAGAVAVAGAAAAGGAADPKAEFFNKIDDAFKTDKVANAIKEYKDRAAGAGNISQSKNDVQWVSNNYKHFPKNQDWKKTIKETKGGPAKYKFSDKNKIEFLERETWKNGTPTKKLQTWKVMKFNNIIGASEGVETEYMVVKMSANTIHGQPITIEEYNRLLKI